VLSRHRVAGVLPFVRYAFHTVLSLTEEVPDHEALSFGSHATRREYKHREEKYDASVPIVATEDTMAYVTKVYGVTQADEEAYAELCSKVTSLPWRVNHPAITRMMDKDEVRNSDLVGALPLADPYVRKPTLAAMPKVSEPVYEPLPTDMAENDRAIRSHVASLLLFLDAG